MLISRLLARRRDRGVALAVILLSATGMTFLAVEPGWPIATCSAKGQCSCPDTCNGADPCPPGEEIPVTCDITGPTDYCTYPGGCPSGEFVSSYGNCCYVNNSPIIVDLASDGFQLTDIAYGIPFSVTGADFLHQVSWTVPDGNDAWLALDRNGNGRIDGGSELFGNFTPQPPPPPGQQRNGFLALAAFDAAQAAGNGNGRVDSGDAVFAALRLWRDANHDGVSQPGELLGLPSHHIDSIDLDYRMSGKRDAFGNQFRYRSKVHSSARASVGVWAYDVFLKTSRMQ